MPTYILFIIIAYTDFNTVSLSSIIWSPRSCGSSAKEQESSLALVPCQTLFLPRQPWKLHECAVEMAGGVYQILPGVEVSGANQNEWYKTQVILVDRDRSKHFWFY
jgi:hypothetical protein